MGKLKVVDEDEVVPSDDEFGDYFHEGRLFTGIACEKDPKTGARMAVTGFRDGKLHGAARTWYPNGQLAQESFHYGGGHHGPQYEWYPDGKLKSAGYVDRGVTVWKRTWNERGELTSSLEAAQSPEQSARLAEARKALPRDRVTDIDLNTWEFVEQPEGWRLDERPQP